jgi:hypothetical protein
MNGNNSDVVHGAHRRAYEHPFYDRQAEAGVRLPASEFVFDLFASPFFSSMLEYCYFPSFK